MTATLHEHDEDLHADQEHAHPTQLHYIGVALVLAVITGVEVALSYYKPVSDHNALLIALLMPLMIVKFAIVAAEFMHLRFDSRWFRRAFITGIILATVVYGVVFATFQFSSVQDHVHVTTSN
jgi:cytochrome c oxidase subunit IV